MKISLVYFRVFFINFTFLFIYSTYANKNIRVNQLLIKSIKYRTLKLTNLAFFRRPYSA